MMKQCKMHFYKPFRILLYHVLKFDLYNYIVYKIFITPMPVSEPSLHGHPRIST